MSEGLLCGPVQRQDLWCPLKSLPNYLREEILLARILPKAPPHQRPSIAEMKSVNNSELVTVVIAYATCSLPTFERIL